MNARERGDTSSIYTYTYTYIPWLYLTMAADGVELTAVFAGITSPSKKFHIELLTSNPWSSIALLLLHTFFIRLERHPHLHGIHRNQRKRIRDGYRVTGMDTL